MSKKCFTVGYQMQHGYSRGSKPFIRFGGDWLKEYGFDVGDKVQLLQGKNMLILMKTSKAG